MVLKKKEKIKKRLHPMRVRIDQKGRPYIIYRDKRMYTDYEALRKKGYPSIEITRRTQQRERVRTGRAQIARADIQNPLLYGMMKELELLKQEKFHREFEQAHKEKVEKIEQKLQEKKEEGNIEGIKKYEEKKTKLQELKERQKKISEEIKNKQLTKDEWEKLKKEQKQIRDDISAITYTKVAEKIKKPQFEEEKKQEVESLGRVSDVEFENKRGRPKIKNIDKTTQKRIYEQEKNDFQKLVQKMPQGEEKEKYEKEIFYQGKKTGQALTEKIQEIKKMSEQVEQKIKPTQSNVIKEMGELSQSVKEGKEEEFEEEMKNRYQKLVEERLKKMGRKKKEQKPEEPQEEGYIYTEDLPEPPTPEGPKQQKEKKRKKKEEQEGEGDTNQKGMKASDFFRLLNYFLVDDDKYEMTFITDDKQKIQQDDMTKGNIMVFLKDGHYTIGIYEPKKGEIAYFDPLAEKKNLEQNMQQLKQFSFEVQPQYELKLKYNKEPMQCVGNNEHDCNACSAYCLVFFHNYVNLDEEFKEATDYDKKEDQEVYDKAHQKFPFI